MARMTKAEAARALGMTERNLYAVLKRKTPSRAYAERLASLLGGAADDYLRPALARGRPKLNSADEYTFRQFTEEANSRSAEGDYSCTLAFELAHALSCAPATPEHFDSFGHLFRFVRENFPNAPVFVNEAELLWKDFRRWRAHQKYQAELFDIEMGDSL